MSESGDYDPGEWKGHDFGSAKKSYDVHVGRSYDDAVDAGKDKKDFLAPTLKTDSESPLVILCDVTGSMGEWPAVIFSKLPYLDLEGKEYMGKGMEVSFAAIGDAYTDQYPLQVRPFDKGKNLEKRLKELIIEGKGGGQSNESYDLGALYYARNVSMPNAINPLLIFIGDEGLYDYVDKDQAKEWVGRDISERLSAKQVMQELQRKFSVYLIRKPYNSDGDSRSPDDKRIYAQWESMLGADRIAVLPEAGRVVDVIFGIMARETDRIGYFDKEIKDRQRPDQVNVVMKSLHDIHNGPAKKTMLKLGEGKSIVRRSSSGKDAKSLL